MKHVLIATLLAGSASMSAFAQTPAPAQAGNGISQAAQAAAPDPNPQRVPPSGQPPMQKTRAEVFQELIHAERDGQLKYLDSTLYAHP